MTTIAFLLAIVLILGGAGWWGYNWWADWTTRLRRRLPAPPPGMVWELKTEYQYGFVYHALFLFDVLTEKSTQVREIYERDSERVPSSENLDSLIVNGRLKARRIDSTFL